ncbi:hypothetical protein FNO01nite_33950 [Flavobacterium noncentrifugens]|uniref:Uncharacterized protein n=1 Tax=Flavobacterium noncentrifugens TaxID=1128970 RepID=A0A1G9DCZ0_9FLAO|nr:hypothetical protein [Flavobacterium noncentrifugens]GEP52723.1 hypothetical protein FNO01nite_33950 [Flavobacterium noncentrifugens]SDK61719.1 hypothetical protein SAMN04487935_3784 [Flavobacterium noncentrifugens]
MENQLSQDEDLQIEERTSPDSSLAKNNTGGKITEFIGKGEDAKNTFVYLTITWAFKAGIAITTLIYLNGWLFRQNEKVPDIIGEVSTAWQFIIPLITLALGYAFGKSKS